MKMKRLKKVVSLVLSVAMVGTLTSIYTKNAHAEEYKYTYGNFEYIVDDLDDAIITKYNGTEKNLVIPSDLEGHMVVKLERGSFKDVKTVTSITIPESVTEIGSECFSGDVSLKDINIPSQVKKIGVLFIAQTQISEVTIPKTIEAMERTYYSNSPFDGSNVKKISFEAGIENIPENAASGAGELTEVVIPDGVKTIGANAFSDCVKLETVALPESVTEIGSECFSGDVSLKDINIPSKVKKIGVLFIAQTQISEVTIPKTIEAMERTYYSNSPFDESNVKKISFEAGIENIPENAASGAGELTEVVIPDGVKTIGVNAFSDCAKLETVALPESVTEIGSECFNGDVSLKELNIPTHIKKIGVLFIAQTQISEVTIPKTIEVLERTYYSNSPFDESNVKKISFEAGIENIPENAASGAGKLTEIVIPDGVKTIGANAFSDCAKLETVALPESVTEIGSECFNGDVSLKELNIPTHIKKIGVLFIAQTQISEVTIPKTIEAMERTYYSNSPFDESNVKKISFEAGIENIPENAASGAGKLTEVVIPDGVKTIGANAFSDCAKLETVALPESVTEIGSECFNGDVSLKELNIPTHIKKIGVLFIAQTQISEVTIPKTIEAMERTYYSNSPFDESNVKKISFEAGIENIPENAASGAGKLTEVVIPDGVKIIGANAFSDCAKLENIAIPESVTEIGQSCFEGDSMISEIKLSNGIKTIKSYAFANCEKLGEIVIPSSVESISDGAFINTNSKIYCNYRSESTMNLVESDIDFISSEENDPESNIIDRQNSFYTINANGISINNTIALNVKMTIKDSQKGSGEERTLIIRIPKSTEILFPSIKVNGKYVAESEINYNEDSETLTIPVMEDSVEVTFNVKVSAKEKIKSYAYVTDNDANGKKIIDVIDTINEYFDGLTINAPEISSDKTVHIRGIADKDKTIDLFVNGEKVTSVASKKNGSYEADVEIKHDNNLDKSVIEAKCTDNNGEEISKSTTVIYQEKTPKMTEFELIYYDHYDEEFHCNLLNTNGIVPRIYWYPGLGIKFKAKFENTEQISHIYVTSTKNGIKKSIEAFYDEESGYYITTDAFDTNDYNYIPGAISVEYNNKSYKITNADALEFIESVNKTGGVAEKTKVTYTKKTDTSVEGSVDLSAFSKNDEKLIVDTKAEQIELVNEQDLNNLRQKYQITDKAYKYYQVDENGSETCFETQNLEDGSVSVISYPVYIHGTIEHSVRYSRSSSRSIAGGYNWKVHNYNSSGVTIPFDMEPINDIVSDMDYVPESVKLGVQMLTNHQDYEKLVQEIMQSSDISNKAEAQRMAQDYIIMKQLCAIGLTCFSVACPEMAITNFLLSQISDFAFSEYRKYILGEDLLLSWLIDPSGYIYDEDTKKRINGAKVTAYWIPYDDSEEFWDNKPSLDTYGEVWDGLEYEQLNPIITEVEGKYAWDVPEGWWRVKCEKEGYETVWTDWMPVPPIQTDVNIALKSLYQTVYGDVDNNGKVETADAVLLNKYLAGYSGLDINLEAADTDNNGKIETADTVYLLKYLAGYQIALG